MKKIKQEKGAITLFVLISMIFFVVVLVGIYTNSSYKIQKQQKELQKIQESYETDDIDEIYNKNATKQGNYILVNTYEEIRERINSENYIILANDIIANNYLTINHTVTIDLNGYSYLISEQENDAIIIAGNSTEVTIKDSSTNKTGAIVTKSTGKNLISIENNAKLILENGELCNDNLSNRDTKIIHISESSEFIMKNGIIIGKIIQEGITTINSGKVIGDIFAKMPNVLSINEVTIQGKIRLLNGVKIKELSDKSKVIQGIVNTYFINKHIIETHGVLDCNVNNIAVEYADVGDKVYIKATPNEGYTVKSYKVYKKDDISTNIELLEDSSFIMPDYEITVQAIYGENI